MAVLSVTYGDSTPSLSRVAWALRQRVAAGGRGAGQLAPGGRDTCHMDSHARTARGKDGVAAASFGNFTVGGVLKK
jgi:hypothetical protein